jgi:hypothetical protein
MPNQDQQAQQTQSKDEQAEKLRRVLSVKDPVDAQAKSATANPKPATR